MVANLSRGIDGRRDSGAAFHAATADPMRELLIVAVRKGR